MDLSTLNLNEIIGFAIATICGGIGSHWVKMRKDIKSAHTKIRDIKGQLEKLEREVKDDQGKSGDKQP